MLLNAHEHAHLYFLPINNHCFAAQQPYVTLLDCDVEALAGGHLPIILPAEGDCLPLGLVVAGEQEDPLGRHTPATWAEYPFSLLESAVGVAPDGQASAQAVVQIEPNAPHWSPDTGYALFQAGRPTAFLQGVVKRLRRQQASSQRTRDMVALLHDVGALVPAMADYQGKTYPMYRIVLAGLDKRLEATGSPIALTTYAFATLVDQSQARLFLRYDSPISDSGSSYLKGMPAMTDSLNRTVL